MRYSSTAGTFAAAAKALSSTCGTHTSTGWILRAVAKAVSGPGCACTPLPGAAGGSLSVYALSLLIIAAETANYAKINEIEESAGANYGKHADRQA